MKHHKIHHKKVHHKKVHVKAHHVPAHFRMVKTTSRGLRMDKMRKAKLAGRRVSKKGHVYYEYRSNRADRSRRKRV